MKINHNNRVPVHHVDPLGELDDHETACGIPCIPSNHWNNLAEVYTPDGTAIGPLFELHWFLEFANDWVPVTCSKCISTLSMYIIEGQPEINM
jgi:hypothetical protein